MYDFTLFPVSPKPLLRYNNSFCLSFIVFIVFPSFSSLPTLTQFYYVTQNDPSYKNAVFSLPMCEKIPRLCWLFFLRLIETSPVLKKNVCGQTCNWFLINFKITFTHKVWHSVTRPFGTVPGSVYIAFGHLSEAH